MKKILLSVALIVCFASGLEAQVINGLEYWVDANYNQKISKTVSGGSTATIVDEFDVSSVTNGMHILSVRFRDNSGRWTGVSDYVFFKAAGAAGSSVQVTTLEYWVDGNYATKSVNDVTAGGGIQKSSLSFNALSPGVHIVSLRFKDNNELWSPISDYVFFKNDPATDDVLNITAYRYWYDNDSPNLVDVTINNPAPTVLMYQLLDLKTSSPDQFPLLFSIQFRDNSGIWSAVYTKQFVPEPSFESFKYLNTFTFRNTSSFSRKFLWNFGDGSTDTTVNPKHTYKQPGVYTVTLTATNTLGTRDSFDVVEVQGLREVVSNRAGNSGDASLLIYGGGFSKDATVWLDGPSRITADTSYIERQDAVYARFDLRSKSIGIYDVYVQFPGESAMMLEKAFTIEQGTVAQPFVNLGGRDRILFGRWQNYQLTVGNKGNVDASGVPLILVVSKASGLELDFGNLRIVESPATESKGLHYLLDSIPLSYDIDELFGEPFNGSVYVFYIPFIPANSARTLDIRFKTNESFRVYAWMNSPYFQSPFDDAVAECLNEALAWYVAEKGLDLGIKFIPGAGCLKNIGKESYGTMSRVIERKIGKDADGKPYKGWGDWAWGWGNWAVDMAAIGVGCAMDVFPPTKAAKFAYATYKTIIELNKIKKDVRKLASADAKCREKFKHLSKSEQGIRAVSSMDPNELTGPSGFGSGNFISNQSPFTYRIFFENKATASAAAQEVLIVDTLDKRVYDLSTFSFGAFSYSGKINNPLSSLSHFTVDIDSVRNGASLLRVHANLDTVTGIITWQFITLNPATMDYPDDPDAGFLPPNRTSPEGEGFVSFSVRPYSTIGEGMNISTRAMITFDLNAPIFTNVHSNMYDVTAPVSKLTGIYGTMTPNYYKITLNASDALSGIHHYTLFASRNDSAFIPVHMSNQNPMYYQCDAGVRYTFYCLATDSVGNEEVEKTSAEVSTSLVSVQDDIPVMINGELRVYPNPAMNEIHVEFNAESDGSIELGLYDVVGVLCIPQRLELASGGMNHQVVDVSSLADGVYVVNVKSRNRTLSTKVMIVH